MEYICDRDLAYIKNKYHDTTKPYDHFQRFILNDGIYDPATGLDGESMCRLVREEDAKIAHLPHSLRKARAFRLVLENTRLDTDPRDYFPAIHAQDRKPIAQLIGLWKHEVFTKKLPPEVGADLSRLERAAACASWLDYDHNIPIWDRLFALGFPGILAEAKAARETLAAKSPLTERQEAFFEGICITYEAVLTLIDRLIAHASARPDPGEKTPELLEALTALRKGAPRTLYETLLLIYLYFMCSEHIEGLQVRSLCHMDRLLTPYYRRDRAAGISEEKLRQTVAYFYMQFAAIDNYWGQPMYMGGTLPDGTTAVTEFSYILLDVYDRMGIFNPKIQIRFDYETAPEAFIRQALDMIRRGHSSIVFVNEQIMMKHLLSIGIPEQQARLCEISGCYEIKLPGSAGSGMNYTNLMKPLEYVMHRGRDGITGEQMGPDTGEDFPTFESFFDAYKVQLSALIDRVYHLVNAKEEFLAEINPQNMLAATFPLCLELGKDPYEGAGTINDTEMEFGFLASTADALTMIKKYVYDQKELTIAEFTEILDRNWEGAEELRERILADPDHYGNNRDLPDAMAVELSNFFSSYINGRPNAKIKGGRWQCSTHVARMSYIQGEKTLASPDGRRTGEELSKNASAAMGMNRQGATAAILSVTKLDSVALSGDCTLDLGLLPSAVQGADGLDAMTGLLYAHARLGGLGIHFNVFQGDTLRDAQAHPEKYPDLQIRVCGWNVLFNQMKKVEQDGFIRQAENLMA